MHDICTCADEFGSLSGGFSARVSSLQFCSNLFHPSSVFFPGLPLPFLRFRFQHGEDVEGTDTVRTLSMGRKTIPILQEGVGYHPTP